MKATVETKQLKKALTTLAKIGSPTIHIRSEGDIVRFTATNYEATLSIGLPHEMDEDGEHIVSLKDLRRIVAASKDKYTALISASRRRLMVRGYTLNNELAGFPELTPIEGATMANLTELKRAVDMVKHAAVKDDSRPTLQAIKIGTDEIAAADGFRLALYAMDTPFQGLYSAKYLPIILSPFTEAFIAQDQYYLYISDGNSRAWLHATQGTFPDYQRVIPVPEHAYEVNALALAHMLPSTYPPNLDEWDRKKKEFVRLYFNGSLRIVRDDYTAEYPATGSGDCKVALPRRQLKEALTVSAGPTTIGIVSPTDPVLFTNGQYREVVMPIHLREGL